MPIRIVLSTLLSVTLSGCWLFPDAPMASRPVGVRFDLPTHLRDCARALGVTDPSKIATVGELLAAYGTERTGRAEVTACHAEIVRLIDVHNANMTSGGLAP